MIPLYINFGLIPESGKTEPAVQHTHFRDRQAVGHGLAGALRVGCGGRSESGSPGGHSLPAAGRGYRVNDPATGGWVWCETGPASPETADVPFADIPLAGGNHQTSIKQDESAAMPGAGHQHQRGTLQARQQPSGALNTSRVFDPAKHDRFEFSTGFPVGFIANLVGPFG